MKYLCYDSALNGEYTLIRLMQKYPRHLSLFKGTDDEDIWDAAPYLFEVEDDFLAMRSNALISLQHCLLFVSAEPREEICRFLQYYVYMNESSYLRLWDARVLQRQLMQWDEKEKIKFFDFFKGVYTIGETDHSLNNWHLDRRLQVITSVIAASELLKPATEIQDSKEDGPVLKESGAIEAQETDKSASPAADTLPGRRRFFID